jgi:membrane protein DedA with SNARE-associated domain
MFDRMIDFFIRNENHSLMLAFLILLACGLGLPIPEDITLVATGVIVSAKVTNIWKSIFVCMSGVLIGDSFIYFIGRYSGRQIFKHPFIMKLIKPQLYQSARNAFSRFGVNIIFIARFLPGLRAPVFYFAGATKKSYAKFILIDGMAALISVPIWVYVGKVFGENLDYLEILIKKMKFGSLLIGLFLIILFILGGMFKNRMINILNKKE